MKVKLIYGTDTGNTEVIKEDIINSLDEFDIDVVDVYEITPKDWDSHEFYILGIPTWYDGDLQSDWEDFFPDFKKIDFTGKEVFFFGLGDQYGYPDNFVDGIGILAKVVLENGGEVFGHWPNKGYEFNESLGLMNDDLFYGLVIDEDNQQDQTDQRIKKWVKQIKNKLIEL